MSLISEPYTQLPELATVPTTKAAIQEEAKANAAAFLESGKCAVRVWVEIARIEAYLSAYKEAIKETAIRHATGYTSGTKSFQLNKAEIQIKQTATYTYNDPILKGLEAKVKDRKNYLKSVKAGQPIEEADPETGEIFRPCPAIAKGSETLSVTLK